MRKLRLNEFYSCSVDNVKKHTTNVMNGEREKKNETLNLEQMTFDVRVNDWVGLYWEIASERALVQCVRRAISWHEYLQFIQCSGRTSHWRNGYWARRISPKFIANNNLSFRQTNFLNCARVPASLTEPLPRTADCINNGTQFDTWHLRLLLFMLFFYRRQNSWNIILRM